MTRRSTARLLAALLLGAAVAAAGCGRPEDEHWLRVVGFEDAAGDPVSTITSALHWTTPASETAAESSAPGGADYVTVLLANQSEIVGTQLAAGGVTVEQVRIAYAIAGLSPPDAVLSVTAYVPVTSVTTTDGVSTTSYASLRIPLVDPALKSWLVHNVPTATRERGFSGTARLTLSAEADDGFDVETQASIGILFVDAATPAAADSP